MIHLMTYIMTNIMTNIMINVMTAWKKVHSHSGQLSKIWSLGQVDQFIGHISVSRRFFLIKST